MNNNHSPQNRLKIGYIMQADTPDLSIVSATQLHVTAVIRGLRKRGHQVSMVAVQHEKNQWTEDLLNWHHTEFGLSDSTPFHLIESIIRGVQSRLRLPFWRLFDSYRFSDACVSSFAGYDILYERESTISYGGIIAARRLGIPIVLEVNGDLVEEWQQLGLEMSKMQWAIVHLITRQIYKQASHIVTVGETIKQRLIHRWSLDPSHVSVVTNGAEIDLFQDMDTSSNIRSRYSIGDGPVIMFMGGFKPWHGVDLILQGFSHIARIVPEAIIVFVGDGPLRSELQQQSDSLGLNERVIFTGRVDHEDVPQLLNMAEIAVIYHRKSAAEIVETPLKLFEYMAAGKAIVAPAVPNMERILKDNISARLVPPDDPEALGRALITLLADDQLRTSLGEAARKEAVERHSWDRAVAELESILFGLLQQKKGNWSKAEGRHSGSQAHN